MPSSRTLLALLTCSIVLNILLLKERADGITPSLDTSATSTSSSKKDSYYTSGATHPLLRVVDGDTLIIAIEDEAEYVRLIGLNTPEPNNSGGPECYAQEATQKLKELVQATGMVTLYFDPSQGLRDKYGRLLAYVELPDGTDLAKDMIREGYGHEYTYDLPYERQTAYKDAERDAVNRTAGLWADTACPS